MIFNLSLLEHAVMCRIIQGQGSHAVQEVLVLVYFIYFLLEIWDLNVYYVLSRHQTLLYSNYMLPIIGSTKYTVFQIF